MASFSNSALKSTDWLVLKLSGVSTQVMSKNSSERGLSLETSALMPLHVLDDQIESRRNGVVVIIAIRPSELWVRCRLKLLSDPSRPFDETMYKCTALKTYDPKLHCRNINLILTPVSALQARVFYTKIWFTPIL